MQANDLAKLLRETYDKAPARGKSLHMTLFGIKYANELDGLTTKDICAQAGTGKCGPQLNLAKKLAPFVSLK